METEAGGNLAAAWETRHTVLSAVLAEYSAFQRAKALTCGRQLENAQVGIANTLKMER